MRHQRVLALLALVLLLSTSALGAEASFLFIGNSHTDANYLTTLFAGLAEVGGHPVHVENSTLGGSTLSYHTHYQPTLDKIQERPWDHVVLQEHSLLPVIDYWRLNSFYPSAAKLDSIITASGSHTTLFCHWARPFPMGEYCVFDHCSREFVDYFDMQAEMSAAYPPIAASLGVPLIMAGDAWAAALRIDPDLPLWGGDDLHSSAEGAYFTACIFYRFFFEESPVGLPFYGPLDAATALQYQQLVDVVVTGVEVPGPDTMARLLPSRPNPFNPMTEVRFEVGEPGLIEVTVHDVAGRLVTCLQPGAVLAAGPYRRSWDGRNDAGRAMPSGTYLVKLRADDGIQSQKLTLVR